MSQSRWRGGALVSWFTSFVPLPLPNYVPHLFSGFVFNLFFLDEYRTDLILGLSE